MKQITSLARLCACSVSVKKIKDQGFKGSPLKSCSAKCHKKGRRTLLQIVSKTKTQDLTIKKVILHCVPQSEASSCNRTIMDSLTPQGDKAHSQWPEPNEISIRSYLMIVILLATKRKKKINKNHDQPINPCS